MRGETGPEWGGRVRRGTNADYVWQKTLIKPWNIGSSYGKGEKMSD